jgi:hypothetical protein
MIGSDMFAHQDEFGTRSELHSSASYKTVQIGQEVTIVNVNTNLIEYPI